MLSLWFFGWVGTLFLSSTRVIFAAAFDRVLPDRAAEVSEKRKVPVYSLILMLLPALPEPSVAEQLERLGSATARQDAPAQLIAVRARESAVRVHPGTRVARQHLAPEIRVIARRILVVKDMAEVR